MTELSIYCLIVKKAVTIIKSGIMSSKTEVKDVPGVGQLQLYPDNIVPNSWVIKWPQDSCVIPSYEEAKCLFDNIKCEISLRRAFC